MNSTIMAERMALATAKIERETERLGGTLVAPSVRASSPAAKYVLMLEAIADALMQIGAPASVEKAVVEDAGVVEAAAPEAIATPTGKRKGL